MSDALHAHRELLAVARPRGEYTCSLDIGAWNLRLEGLDVRLVSELEERLGGFVVEEPSRPIRVVASVVGGPSEAYLEGWKTSGAYRLEAESGSRGLLVRSYHFALAPAGPRAWRLGLSGAAGRDEPLGRVVENALRYLVARLAIESGGVALHAAGVEREGRAYILAGPSRSGKTTAVGMLAPARSLGDDLAVVLPAGGGWGVPALPFDNSERAPADPPRELFPLAGVFRLVKAKEGRVEKPPLPLAIASLLACAAFPWAMPDLREKVATQAERLVTGSSFAHLHFALDSNLWPLVSGSAS